MAGETRQNPGPEGILAKGEAGVPSRAPARKLHTTGLGYIVVPRRADPSNFTQVYYPHRARSSGPETH